MKRDKKEYYPWNRKKFKTVNKILEKEFSDESGIGTIHAVWERKKQLLKEMYGMDWKSPADLNPFIRFD